MGFILYPLQTKNEYKERDKTKKSFKTDFIQNSH